MTAWFRRKPEFTISKAEPEDLDALAEIHAEGFPHGWDADELAALIASFGMAVWVARTVGARSEPLGFVLVRNTGQEAEIITIATSRSVRRHGVGNALMAHTIRQLQHDRVERLFLEVSETNQAALALYRSLGFRQVGERKAYYASHVAGRRGDREGAPSTPPPSALVMERVLR